MTKTFLITVDTDDSGQLAQPVEYFLSEFEAFAGSLFEYHAKGAPPKVTCQLVHPHPHVLHDNG